MLYQTFPLRPEFPDATLTTYVCDYFEPMQLPPRPAVIVCPGGAYTGLANRESEPIVRHFLGAHFNVFLLRYSVGENAKDYNPAIDVALAVRYVREHAKEHHTDPNRIVTCGFSAGGHLAASAGVFWNLPVIRDAVGVTDGSAPEGINRPNGMILCYPVITAGVYANRGSIHRLCGTSSPTEEEKARFSLELFVDETTPPAFLWHTFTDTGVNVRNSLLMMDALLEHGIPFEAHIYPQGPHGTALGTKETWHGSEAQFVPHLSSWADLAVNWIRDII